VPEGLQGAVARVLANGKTHQTWLKRSLGTKSLQEAHKRAKPVQIEFDGILEQAEELVQECHTRTALSRVEVKRMAEYHYATLLAVDAAARREARQIAAEDGAAPATDAPAHGLTNEEFERIGRGYDEEVKAAQAALARGNIHFVEGEIDELLEIFRMRLDPSTAAYRQFGAAVLAEHVKALQALQRRQAGEPVDTPRQPEVNSTAAGADGNGLRAAFEGWKKAKARPQNTVGE
jgi:hypothetical protein